MIQISGRKKYLALVALSFPFIMYASDSEKSTSDKGATLLQWACRGGTVVCTADLFFNIIPWPCHGENLLVLKASEFVLGCVLMCEGWFCDVDLKKAQKEHLGQKIEQKEHVSICLHDPESSQPEISSEDEQEEETLGEYQKESKHHGKKRLRDKFKSWLHRFK